MISKTFLIVDDDAMQRNCISNFCKKRKIPAETAESYDQAIEKIKAAPNKYSVIMIDLYLDEDPNITAYKLSGEIKAIAGDQLGKLILMSGGKIDKYN